MIARDSFWHWFGGLWFVVGGAFAASGGVMLWQERVLDERLAREGASTAGVVLEKRIYGGGNKRKRFEVEYRFRAPGGTLTEKAAEVDGETWDALVEGEPVAVQYVRGAPELHRLAGQEAPQLFLGLMFAAVGSLFALSGLVILWRAAVRRRFLERLRIEGASASAEVLDVLPASFRINRVPQWVIRYRYNDLFGKTHESRTPLMPREEAEQWQAGDRGTVRFEPNRPRRSVWMGKG